MTTTPTVFKHYANMTRMRRLLIESIRAAYEKAKPERRASIIQLDWGRRVYIMRRRGFDPQAMMGGQLNQMLAITGSPITIALAIYNLEKDEHITLDWKGKEITFTRDR
jgi:hypothetical protein